MPTEQALKEKIQFFEQTYSSLLAQALQDLKVVEQLADAAQKDQQVQQVITNIEFALEELKPELKQFKAGLGASSSPSKLFYVPDLPKHRILDTPVFEALKAKLHVKGINPQNSPIIIEAAGGMGKSLLAARIAHDEAVQALFPDGIFWLGLGETPNLFQHYADIAKALGRNAVGFIDLDQATAFMQDIFAARTSLFILDEVADLEAVLAINRLGVNCRVLVTTVEGNLYDFVKYKAKQAIRFQMQALDSQDTKNLLLNGADCKDNPPAELAAIIAACENNPLCLQLVASLAAMQKPTDWAYLLERLQEDDWEFPEDYDYRLMMALHLYIEALGEQGECYLVLAVFDDYTRIPLNTISMLWQHMFNLPKAETKKLVQQFAETGLLHLHRHAQGDYISLHAFQHAYIQDNSDLDKLHLHVLSAYGRQTQQGWVSGPDDGYFYQNLCIHLAGAGRTQELRALLLDFDWIEKKLQSTNLHSLIGDYDLLQEDAELAIVQHALYSAAHELMKQPEHLATELLDHLWEKDSRDIQAMLNQAKESVPAWEPPMPSDDL